MTRKPPTLTYKEKSKEDLKEKSKKPDTRSEWEKVWVPTQIPDIPELDNDLEPEPEPEEPEKTSEPECGAYLEDEEEDNIVGASFYNGEPLCILRWCDSCKVEYSQNHSCEEFQEWKAELLNSQKENK